MVIGDFGPEIIYIPQPPNVVANAISCLDMTNDPENTKINCDSNMENHLIELINLFVREPFLDDIYPQVFSLSRKSRYVILN